MYYDLNCSNAIQPCSQINKDIIICFILLGVSKGELYFDLSIEKTRRLAFDFFRN